MPDNPFPGTSTRPRAFRRNLLTLILPGLWLLFVVMTALGTVVAGIPIIESLFGIGESPGAYEAAESASLAAHEAAPFAVCLWGLAAALFLRLVVVRNRRGWPNGKRFALGGIALAMMVGCLLGGGLLAFSLSFLGAPSWVSFVVAPFSLCFGGAFSIAAFGLAAFLTFATLVGVPSVIFNQIFTFEHAIRVYHYQTDGLTGYIVRFMRWLRNGPAPPPMTARAPASPPVTKPAASTRATPRKPRPSPISAARSHSRPTSMCRRPDVRC